MASGSTRKVVNKAIKTTKEQSIKRMSINSDDELLSGFSESEMKEACTPALPNQEKAVIGMKKQVPSKRTYETCVDDVPTSKPRSAMPATSMKIEQEPSAELAEIQIKYESLYSEFERIKKETVKEAETCFSQYKSLAEERFAAYEQLISQLTVKANDADMLQNEITTLQATTDGQKKEIENLKISMQKNAADNKEKLEHAAAKMKHNLEQIIKFYSQASGIKVITVEETKRTLHDEAAGAEATVEDEVLVFNCEQTGRNGKLYYSIIIPFKGDFYSYIPDSEKMNMSQLQLPEYLCEEIEFDKSMVGLFFWRVCDWLQQSNI